SMKYRSLLTDLEDARDINHIGISIPGQLNCGEGAGIAEVYSAYLCKVRWELAPLNCYLLFGDRIDTAAAKGRKATNTSFEFVSWVRLDDFLLLLFCKMKGIINRGVYDDAAHAVLVNCPQEFRGRWR